MNLSSRRREEPTIDLTPLIDVVFLLLIFFMVSTTFRRESDLQIDLPEASTKSPQTEQHQLILGIDADGNYSVNDRALPDGRRETIGAALAEAAGEDRDQALIIRADARTPHQAVVTAMDAAGRLGFRRLAIATVQSPDTPAADHSAGQQ